MWQSKKIKPKPCAMCDKEFTPRSSLQKVCSPLCAVKYTQAQKAKKAAKLERAKVKQKREELATVPELTKKAQAAFNAFIRARDKGKPCISCGAPLGHAPNSYDAGHYRSVGSASHLRFDENNVHGQCKKCNRYLSGNAVAYRAGLIERVGIDEVERLERDNTPRKWSKDELRELAEKYKEKNKELRNG